MWITIEMCVNCEKYYVQPFGFCPIWSDIQKGMTEINKAMLTANTRTDLLSVVVSGHWLAECKFECKYNKPKATEENP